MIVDVARQTYIELPLSVIRTDGGTQIRSELNWSRIDELVELLREGCTFKDPIVVFYDGTDYWTGDGFHRIEATKQAGLPTIDTDVKSGTREEAIEYACGANATHGLPRANRDKRNAVERLLSLPRWQQGKSNREIARQCGVTEHLVRIVKDELPDDHPCATKSQSATNQPVEPVEEVEEVRLKRTTNEEKRKTVEDFIAETPQWQEMGNREIARICGVSESLVRTIKSELEPEPEKHREGETEQVSLADIFDPVGHSIPTAYLPPNWNLVDEEPCTLPLPNGASVEIPEEWKLPVEMRGEGDGIIPPPVEMDRGSHDDAPLEDHLPAPSKVLDSPQDLEVIVEPEQPQVEIEEEETDKPEAKSATLTALQSSESNEWFTPALYVYAARKLMGGIDVDPASNEVANKIIRATTYYDIETKGLGRNWYGRIWLNPPYGLTEGRSNQEIWSAYLIDQFKKGNTKEAVLLVNANTEAKWFQSLYNYPICFTDHRIHFYNTDGDHSQPTQGNAFVYFGPKEKLQQFKKLFSQFGNIGTFERWHVDESGKNGATV